ncbi:hypothetical protein [Bythopirellula polymerisocia]|uniref:Lipoprotein n=1 Tax=Bythopirellula polymerisocia TaxID=2528003 RepID=A0A5C6C9G4_9BACT|nr:hypothetical protein [Bythopirellula polymerisocia]TWU20792.1 hypothetical protein Pla144_48430 [Bythopirellula polymerisocia]
MLPITKWPPAFSMLFSRGAAVGSFLTCLLLVGCDNSGRVQVTGTVGFNDGGIPQGEVSMIRFEPASYAKTSDSEVRKGAYGYIQPDGSFRMTTLKPDDGVYPGTYKVCFTVLKSYQSGEPLIPRKYMSKKTTPFEQTINETTQGLHFELEKLPGK